MKQPLQAQGLGGGSSPISERRTQPDTGRALAAAAARGPWDSYTQRQRRAFLLVLFLVGTSSCVDRNLVSVLLEPIKAEFHVSDASLGLLSGLAFALLYATLGIPGARWADRASRKVVIIASLCGWSVMTVLCGSARSFWQLLGARFGVGAGEAGIVPTAQSLLADYYSPTERSRAIGIFLTSGAAGYALGLVVGGALTQNYGWRTAYVFFGVLGLILMPVCQAVLQEPRRLSPRASAIAPVESAMTAIRALLCKRAYRNILGALVVYFLMAYGALIFIVSLMIRAYGLSTAQAGATFGAVAAVGTLVGSVVGGAFADRLASKDLAWLCRLAGWGVIVTLPMFEGALWTHSIIAMSILLLVGSTVLSGVVPPVFSAIQVVCGSQRRALSVALVYFFANMVGFGLGPVITGALSDRFGAVYGSADGLRYALMIVMCVLLPSAWLMLRAAPHIAAEAEE